MFPPSMLSHRELLVNCETIGIHPHLNDSPYYDFGVILNKILSLPNQVTGNL